MKLNGFSFILILLLSGCSRLNKEEIIVALQPVGNVTDDKIQTAKQAINSVYGKRVVVLPTIKPPKETFVNIKSARYRADKLIAFLKETKPDSVDYIVGITNYDISTTKRDATGRIKKPKDKYEDFGVFGLGYCPGKSCIISCFRLGNDKKKLTDRLAKISVHELGHNLGLPHCREKTCVMADAAEKISTIDNVDRSLCQRCIELYQR